MNNKQLTEFRATEQLESYAEALGSPEWVQTLRAEARRRFDQMDWPTTREEEWRRSDISSYDFDSYRLKLPDHGTAGASGTPSGDGVSGRVAFRNLECTEHSLSKAAAEAGVVFAPLVQVLGDLNHDPNMAAARTAVECLWRKAIQHAENRIQLWHYSTITHGVVLYVPRFVELSAPFELEFAYDDDGTVYAPHVFAIAETGGRATLTAITHGGEEGEVLVNSGFDFEAGDNGALSFAEMSDLNIDSSLFSNGSGYLGRDATGRHFCAQFGGLFTKARVDGHLNGRGANLHLDGLYFGREDQHMDLRTVQRHNAPNALSLALYKGALLDEARSVYQGLIYVDHDAAQTDAYLTNNNLLLNDGSRADSIPCLQIHTNDVKCSHGSTTGKIDRNQQHYLQTRGFSEAEAKQVLVEGYFDEVIVRAPQALHEELRSIVGSRIMESLEAEED